ncbi:MAG: glycosyltransferase family 2 protein [Proteobacteria bacterium]|jgi:GT2 family glycosyltransferase|nr:glycosyltransferase family 2 protein [Pseudomonadota bacterium]
MQNLSVQTVIVNYNAGAWLPRAVSSALNCIPGPVTVIDNASYDGSVQGLRDLIKDARLKIIQNADNVGFAAANNQVLVNLDTDCVVLMNPDCELEPSAWPSIRDVMLADQSIGLAGARILNADGSDQKTSKRDFPTPIQALLRLLGLGRLSRRDFDRGKEPNKRHPGDYGIEYVDAISGAFMVARAAAIEEVGVLDEGYFMHCEDLDWCKRFWLSGYKVAWVGTARLVHAKGVSSSVRPARVLWYMHRGMDRFFCKFEGKKYNPVFRAVIRFCIYLLYLPRALLALIRKVR